MTANKPQTTKRGFWRTLFGLCLPNKKHVWLKDGKEYLDEYSTILLIGKIMIPQYHECVSQTYVCKFCGKVKTESYDV